VRPEIGALPLGSRPPAATDSSTCVAAMAGAVMCTLVAAPLALLQLRDVTVRTDFAAQASAALGPIDAAALTLEPRFTGSRAQIRGRLDAANGTEVYAAYFARQHEQAEMIAFGNAVVPDDGAGWRVLSTQVHTTARAGAPAQVLEWRVRSGGSQRLLWSWFTVAGTHASGAYRAKALTAWSMLRGLGDHSTISVVGTALPDLPPTASPQDVASALEAARARLLGPASAMGRAAERATAP
jgi:EpsI family protein